MYYLYLILPLFFIILSAVFAIKIIKNGADKKITFFFQIASCVCISLLCSFMFISNCKAVSDTEPKRSISESEASSRAIAYGLGLIAAALALGIGAIGGGMAVASAAPAAIAALTENPNIFGKILMFVIFGEAIAIYGIVISVIILGRLDVLLV